MTACNITPVKILIVDDHGLVREGLQAILSRSELGAQYVEAWDAASLWSQLQQHADIDLVLMDIQLPETSGLSLLADITQRFPLLPVIMLSADHDAGIVQHSLEQGARGFLPKSSLNQVLVSAIRLVAAGGVYVRPTPQPLGSPRGNPRCWACSCKACPTSKSAERSTWPNPQSKSTSVASCAHWG